MRIAFLVKDLQLSGGINVVVEHAHQLTTKHGFDVTIVRTAVQGAPDWPYPGLASVRIVALEDLGAERFDVAVATWWETALHLFEVDADRHAYFVQLLEDSAYPPDSGPRFGFGLTLGLPVRYITEAGWIRLVIQRLQPSNEVLLVRNGIAKDVFSPLDAVPDLGEGPLRVLIEGSPALTRKGVPHALEAVSLMREPHHVTLVTNELPERAALPEPSYEGPRSAPGFEVADEHLGALSHAELREVFARSHVLLKLSRAEGMYGPPLEAFHLGCTVVTSPVTGHDEYVRHRENGLVVDWDDPVGTARALDLLARDRALLGRLRAAALETARAWPGWENASAVMADALRTIASDPPPDARVAGERLTADLGAVLAEVETRILAEKGARAGMKELREQRAVKAAIAARKVATPALSKAKAARKRLRP